MLGRMQPPWCPSCSVPPGPDCPVRAHDTRHAKRREQRMLPALAAVQIDDARAEYLSDLLGWLYDGADCRHGCNGDCYTSGGLRCNFTCHPHYGEG
jgi:hypothetical protein